MVTTIVVGADSGRGLFGAQIAPLQQHCRAGSVIVGIIMIAVSLRYGDGGLAPGGGAAGCANFDSSIGTFCCT